MEVKRLFDILKLYVEKHPEQDVALARKENGSWKKYSIQEYVETTNNLSYAFIKLGIKKDDKVGIICSNRPEWNMLDMAIMQVGAISVPSTQQSAKKIIVTSSTIAELNSLF